MRRGKPKAKSGFVLFDVLYQDGTRSSNRKVPVDALAGPDGDDAAREVLEAQDRQIAERSGKSRGRIAELERVPRK
jgi:hypothetical protein